MENWAPSPEKGWESRDHQFWTHSSQSCLPLEPSLGRQRHFVATSIKDKKERNQTTEKKSSALCVDFEGRSAKGGNPARAGPSSAARREETEIFFTSDDLF